MPDTPAESDDALLIAAVVKGDKRAFRILIDRYERLVVSIVFKMIPQKEDGEDLCQDVFLKVYEKLPTFRFQSRLSTWIGTIAFNTCINFMKKRKLLFLEDIKSLSNNDHDSGIKSELMFIDTGTKPDEQLLDKEKEEVMLKSIERLPVIQRLVLNLFHQNELSLQEISEMTDLPVNTVKSHLFRARKQLKELLGNY